MVFGQIFLVLAGVMFPSIAYNARTRVGEASDVDIIEFLEGIYTKLGQCCHLEDSDSFLKEHLATPQIVKSCKSVSVRNTSIFIYPF